MDHVFDVAIIGGGINGCGCAADAALRGLSVVLCEADDLASKTSSKSSKLIHGGLRYLEQYDFSLVKKALSERQALLSLAPHLVHPLAFVIPHQKKLRPLWMLGAGLFLYDHLSKANQLPRSKLIQQKKQPHYFKPLKNHIKKGFLFYDCATDDARLTISNAIQASAHGASILPHTKLIHGEVIDGLWVLLVEDKSKKQFKIKAKSLINTTGPWVESINQLLKIPLVHTLTLVKGSHLVVKKLYEGNQAYLLQHPDKRIVFAIPYYGCTLVGTTDVPFSGDLNDLHIDAAEISYLSEIIQSYFNIKINESDIITSWSGLRPLLSDNDKTASTLSRDYIYHYSAEPAPSITVYGGKITTYRQLAADAVNQLQTIFPHLPSSSTHKIPLPGAVLGKINFKEYQQYAIKKYDWLERNVLEHYLNNYGTRTEILLINCNKMQDLGIRFADLFYQAEVDYLLAHEWARNSDDVLWRRTKLGLSIDKAEEKALTDYLSVKLPFPQI